MPVPTTIIPPGTFTVTVLVNGSAVQTINALTVEAMADIAIPIYAIAGPMDIVSVQVTLSDVALGLTGWKYKFLTTLGVDSVLPTNNQTSRTVLNSNE